MAYYCFDENRLKAETMTKGQIENSISSLNSKIDTNKQTQENQLNSSYKIKTYSAFSQVPNCTNDTPMRTVAQRMPTPSVLVMYVQDKKYPGDGNGILTIKKNTTTNTAVFEFEEVNSNAKYYCHFFAHDPNNWAATAVNWTRVSNSDIIPHYASFVDTGHQDVTIPANTLKNITVELTPTSRARVVIPNANMHAAGDPDSPRPIIINAMLSDVNKYIIAMYNPFGSDVTGRVSWRTIVDYPAL